MNRMILHIARPVTLWSLHFIAIYALISAACAPRGVLDVEMMRVLAALGTLATLIFMLVWLVQATRRYRQTPETADERPLVVATLWSVAISLIAILANLWPVALLSTCSG